MSQEQARWALGLGPDRPVVPTIGRLTHLKGQWHLIDGHLIDAVPDLADLALRRRQGAAGRRRYGARFTRARMAAETAAVHASVPAGAEVRA